MRHLPWLAAAVFLVAPAMARADCGVPTATRLSIDGSAARVYPTYGYATDPEIYAPIREELASLGVQFQFTGSLADATAGGTRIALWPITRSTASLPLKGKPATVLMIGGAAYLPVRACAELLGGKVDWDYRASLLRIATGHPAPAANAGLQPAQPLQLRPGATPGVLRWTVAATPEQPVNPDPARDQKTQAICQAVAEAIQGLTPGSCVLASAVRTGGRIAARANAAQPSVATTLPPPIRTVVRRDSPVLAFRGGGAARNPQDGIFRAERGPLLGKTICVDAGHGGSSTGAMGLKGMQEKDACMAMACELGRALQESGATVIFSRSDDSYVSLDNRIDFANTRAADLFISIHCNAMPVHNTANGTETYYDTPQSEALAKAIHPQVVGIVGERDGGVRRRGFAVIRRTTMPSVLVEVAFIDNIADEAKLAQPEFRASIGNAIRDGVLRYFQGQ